ncbi:MAG: YdcF family protein [Clostridium sp.]|uniref:YdcF family protein n=1 Tax=Clostridium sp. TaxID=1506 RepID=UPI002FC76DA8
MKKLKIGILVFIIVFISIYLYKMYDIYSFSSAVPAKSDAIIVLGCRVRGEEPSLSLQKRMENGLDLYKKGYGSKIILSGGQGSGENISEAEAMRRFFVKNNVSEKDLIIEDKSTSTYENLKYSKEFMEKEGIEKVVIVSNGYHLLRVSKIAESMNIDASYKGFIIEENLIGEFKGVFREVLASFKYEMLKN